MNLRHAARVAFRFHTIKSLHARAAGIEPDLAAMEKGRGTVMPPSKPSNARSPARADETGKADGKLDKIPPSSAVSFLASSGDRTLHSAKP